MPRTGRFIGRAVAALTVLTIAAVVEADGDTLSVGRFVTPSDTSYFIRDGVDPSSVIPTKLPYSELTKEEAFATLKESENLDCSFGEPDDFTDETVDFALKCYETSFESKNEDGSIAGATSVPVVKEDRQANYSGLHTVSISGSHASMRTSGTTSSRSPWCRTACSVTR